jgi:hypothetical protein
MFSINVTKVAMNDLVEMPQIVNIEAGKGIERLIQLTDPAMAEEVVTLRNHAGFFRWKPRNCVRRTSNHNLEFRIIFSINYQTKVINIVGVTQRGGFDSFAYRRCQKSLATSVQTRD